MKTIDGKPFECTQCGKCCRWGGIVSLTDEDISRLSKHHDLEKENFLKGYASKKKDGKYALKNKKDSSDCIYMKGDKCSIYDIKPEQCDKYPVKYDKRCPGFQIDRSASMANTFEDAVKMVYEKMSSGNEYSRRVADDMYANLDAVSKTASVTEGALEEGIDAFFNNNTIKIASLDDLFAFDRAGKDHLIHKSTHDLWSIDKSKEGDVQITRLFDNSGEPIKG